MKNLLVVLLMMIGGPVSAMSLDTVSTYLNEMGAARSAFTQINPDGTLSTGQLEIKRPGRIRFEYNPPMESLVVASGGQLAIFDPRSNAGVDRYPLNQTPLGLILRRNVDLSAARMVVNHFTQGVSTHVVLQDPDHPEYGTIELVLTDSPVELRQWVVTNDIGEKTTVVLADLQQDVSIDTVRFNIMREMRLRDIER